MKSFDSVLKRPRKRARRQFHRARIARKAAEVLPSCEAAEFNLPKTVTSKFWRATMRAGRPSAAATGAPAASRPREKKPPPPPSKKKTAVPKRPAAARPPAKPAAARKKPVKKKTPFSLNADALACCLFQIEDLEILCNIKAVNHDFCTAARRTLCSTEWRAARLSIHDLLDIPGLSMTPREAALAARAQLYPDELIVSGGPQRLPPLHAAATLNLPPRLMRALLNSGSALLHSSSAPESFRTRVQGGDNIVEVIARRRSRGRLAHHLAALHGASSALAVLLEAFPRGAQHRDGDGCLPLHHAAAAACHGMQEEGEEEEEGEGDSSAARTVTLLLEADPDSASEMDLSGMLPLHYATMHAAPLSVVSPLLSAFPEGCMHEAAHGWTPLALSIVYGAPPDAFSAVLRSWPDGARTRVEAHTAGFPLHLAAKYHPPPKVLRELIQSYPQAAGEADAEGRLPLHHAAASRGDEALISALLHILPEACGIPDGDMYLPLHHAVTNEVSYECVELILHAYPQAAKETINHNRLPLHLAVANHAPAAVVRLLLRHYPQAAAIRTADGYLPLHIASESGASAAAVGALLAAHPSGAKQKTWMGRLPLQLVARRGIVGTDAEDVSSRRSWHDGLGMRSSQQLGGDGAGVLEASRDTNRV